MKDSSGFFVFGSNHDLDWPSKEWGKTFDQRGLQNYNAAQLFSAMNAPLLHTCSAIRRSRMGACPHPAAQDAPAHPFTIQCSTDFLAFSRMTSA
jgi:hypothetical protein